LPETADRYNQELELRQSAFILLRIVKGFSASETLSALDQAAALAEKSGSLRQLSIWIMQRWLPAYATGDLSAAGMYADQALGLALRDGDFEIRPHIHTLQILTRHWRGDLAGCEMHFREGLPYFDDPDFRQSPRGGAVVAFAAASWNAWQLGRTEVARERESRMMAAAKGNKPQNVTFAAYSASFLHALRREYQQAQTMAEQALELAEKHQIPYFAASSRSVLGHALAQLGRASEGKILIRRAIQDHLEAGAGLGVSMLTTWLAAAQAREGAIADALETVERAVQASPEALVYRPETLRLRGELQLKLGNTEMAENDFREAIALAQKMSAKAWELRATMSLVRLLREQGKSDEARAMLADIYGWFTEGFDTADLKDAKALLNELSC
jgi:tetratricopeptide (TPR) repeat protein